MYPSPDIRNIPNRDYTASEIKRIVADNTLFRYQRDDTHTYIEQWEITQKLILAATPMYRKSLIKRASNPNYQLLPGEQEMLRIIYEELE